MNMIYCSSFGAESIDGMTEADADPDREFYRKVSEPAPARTLYSSGGRRSAAEWRWVMSKKDNKEKDILLKRKDAIKV